MTTANGNCERSGSMSDSRRAKLSKLAVLALVESGDQTLIFSKSARIVIYRPDKRLIVNVGPIIDDTADVTTEKP